MSYNKITANSIPESYKKAVYRVWNFGNDVLDERGDWIREICDYSIHIPTDDCSHVPGFEIRDNDFAKPLINKEFAIKRGKDFVYAYGDRLFTFDQLEKTIQALIDNPSTRRAYIPLYNWSDNSKFVEDVPCWVGLQFLLRKGNLNLIDTFRSNDLFYAYPSDAYGARVLQHYVADRIDAKCGWFTHHVGSAHIRMTDEDAVLKFLS